MNLSGRTVVGEVKIKVSFDAGKGQKQTNNLNKGVSNLTKGAFNLGRGFERLGRTISITGFVMGIVARRLIASFEGIAKSIVKISEEGANLDRAFTFLSDTLSALALSGMLTDETFNDIYGTFQRMMDIAMASAGSWAIINAKIQELKNAIAEGALPQLTNLSTFFTEFDMTPFNTALKNATDTFLTPIVDKIKEMLGEGEEGGLTGISAKLNAIAMIGGNFLAGVLEGFDQVMIKAAELVGDDASGIAGISSKLGEFAAWALILAPAGAVVGMIVGGFGSILTAIAGVVALIGGPATLTLIGVIAIASTDMGGLATSASNLVSSLDELAQALGADSAIGVAITYIHDRFYGFNLLLQTTMDLLSGIIDAIARIITGWNNMVNAAPAPAGLTYPTTGTRLTGWEDPFAGGGGPKLPDLLSGIEARREGYITQINTITVNGAKDPKTTADEIERILAQKMRSVYLLR